MRHMKEENRMPFREWGSDRIGLMHTILVGEKRLRQDAYRTNSFLLAIAIIMVILC